MIFPKMRATHLNNFVGVNIVEIITVFYAVFRIIENDVIITPKFKNIKIS